MKVNIEGKLVGIFFEEMSPGDFPMMVIRMTGGVDELLATRDRLVEAFGGPSGIADHVGDEAKDSEK